MRDYPFAAAILCAGLALLLTSPATAAPPDTSPEKGPIAIAPVHMIYQSLNPADVGIWRTDVEVDVPTGMKLTRLIRVYRNGVFDPHSSSGQVSGNTFTPWKQILSLGYFDPDVISPKPSPDLKIIGEAGEFWITLPAKTTVERMIQGTPLKTLTIGKEYPLLTLAIGPTKPSQFISGMSGEVDPDRALIRITVGVRIDPLTAEEKQTLKQQSNFSSAFALEK